MMPTDPSIDTRRPGTGFRAPVWAWIGGLIALFVLVAVVRHLGEERRFAELVEQAKPGWLGVAAALQLATYVCAGGVWYSALRGEPSRPSLARLVPLGLAKLFTDQAVPSSGLSGTLLVVRGLIRLGVPGGRAAIAMLVGTAAYFLAYAIAVTMALLALWWMRQLDAWLLIPASLMGAFAAIVPVVLLFFGRRGRIPMPGLLSRFPGIRELAQELSSVSPGSLFDARLAVETVGLQLGIFVLDAATLGAMLEAIGTSGSAAIVFASFVFASVIASLSWVPGGIGTFEASCVGILGAHGVSVEAALASTLLLRGFTFWLPMLPGLWLARRELSAGRAAAGRNPKGSRSVPGAPGPQGDDQPGRDQARRRGQEPVVSVERMEMQPGREGTQLDSEDRGQEREQDDPARRSAS